MKRRGERRYRIGELAERFGIHPQTLRLYEREGLLLPPRSSGNTRYYTEADLARLELILSFTRDLGVNLAGVEIIMNMRARIVALQQEIARLSEALAEANQRDSARPNAGTLTRLSNRTIVPTRNRSY